MDAVAHACNLSTLGDQAWRQSATSSQREKKDQVEVHTYNLSTLGGQITWGQEFQTSLANAPGSVALACNPSTLGGQSRQISRGQKFKTSLANMVMSQKCTKNAPCLHQKCIKQLVLWEAKAGGSQSQEMEIILANLDQVTSEWITESLPDIQKGNLKQILEIQISVYAKATVQT
ncbi:hypothetical protein AAY473_021587 [Plecturocebus cupreus]